MENIELEPCCKELLSAQARRTIEVRRWGVDVVIDIYLGDLHTVLEYIKFCPFCGKKLVLMEP
jgi:hypothetical protein